MPFITKDKNDLIFDFKLFKFRINTKKNYLAFNNKIIVIDGKTGNETEIKSYKGLTINFKGNNSVVKIYKNTKFTNCKLNIRSNCIITIGESRYRISNLHSGMTNNTTLQIGENFSCRGATFALDDEENKKVIIGNDCMFSNGINIRTSDGHSIYNIETKEIINIGQDIIIGNHVWCGVGSTILKGSKIPDNSIIGAKSLVNKRFKDENIIIAGQPAKIIKTGINWDRNPPSAELSFQ